MSEYVGERRAAFDEAVSEGKAAAEQARAGMQDAYDAVGGEGEAAAESAI